MANSAKDKGDRGERAAVAYLLDNAPDLVSVSRPQRKLGAGRKEDTGDLYIFHDAAIQVRAVNDMGKAVRSAAEDSVVQAGHGDHEYALGMVPVPRARKEQVTWLASTTPDRWPEEIQPVAEFALISKALSWVRDDKGPHGYRVWPREERIALLGGPGTTVLIAPIEAWLAAFRRARSQAQALRPAA
jgi:hypothetical protein